MSQEALNRYEMLFQAARSLNSSLDLEHVLQTVMDELITLTRAERGMVVLLERETGELRFQVARNIERETVEAPEFEVSRTLIHKVIESRQAELVLSAVEDARFSKVRSVIRSGLRSVVCVPLVYREQAFGVVWVDNNLKAGVFKKEDLETLTAFANLAAIAIENARLFSEVNWRMQQILYMKTYQDAIFESVESGIVAIDPTGIITAFNRAAEDIFALKRHNVMHQQVREALHGRAADMMADSMEAVAASGRPRLGEEYAGHFVGAGRVDLQLNFSPLKSAEGQVIGSTLIVNDISERHLLEAERDQHEAEKRLLRETLSKLVSPDVAALAESDPSVFSRSGVPREITIMFSDLKGFTRRAEQLSPDKIIEMLNVYFGEMCQIVKRNQGTVKQFAGDEIMILFNATVPLNDHPVRAVWTAVEMIDRLRELQAEDPEGERGFYNVKIGIHTGRVVVGAVGTEERMEFAAVGDNVNLTQRVMSLNPALGTSILISEDTYYEVYKKIAGSVRFTSRGAHEVKGRETPIKIYEVSRLAWGD